MKNFTEFTCWLFILWLAGVVLTLIAELWMPAEMIEGVEIVMTYSFFSIIGLAFVDVALKMYRGEA